MPADPPRRCHSSMRTQAALGELLVDHERGSGWRRVISMAMIICVCPLLPLQRKQDEILQAKPRLLRLQIELSQLKKRKASMKGIGGIREQLRAVMHRR